MKPFRLSPRQLEVCFLLLARDDNGRFYTDKGIARELGIMPSTVVTLMERAADAIRRTHPHIDQHCSPRRTIHEWYWFCRHEARGRTHLRRAA